MDNINKLILQSISGKPEAQKALYLKYKHSWYQLALRYSQSNTEAKDILQEGLIRIYDNLHQYDAERGAFNTWSCRVIANAALRYQKKQIQHNNWVDLEYLVEAYHEEVAIESPVTNETLVKFIQKLPMGYKLIFNMYVLEGYTHEEIASYMGITEGTSKSQLSKAKKMLRTQLEMHMSNSTNV